jgi:hypothetical protein
MAMHEDTTSRANAADGVGRIYSQADNALDLICVKDLFKEKN